jgi:hypothetical protein
VKKIFNILFALVLVVSLGLVTAAPVLAGTIIHVPGDYETIQGAIDAASDGDTIVVAAGEYDAFEVQGKENISIISTAGATVTTPNCFTVDIGPITGDVWVMAAVNASENIDIEGIDFDGAEVDIWWTGITEAAAGSLHTVGLKDDGTVVAVGENDSGQCDVGGWTGIVQVAAGYGHTVGLKDDGTVVAVGYNDSGQCDVGGWTGIDQVAAGCFHTVGVKDDGTVVAVGDNFSGQCDVGVWTGIDQVAAGWYHTVGVESDGTVVAVGENDSGQCGEAVVGIAYVDSTGSIADLTVANIIGTGLRAGVAIIGDLGTSVVDLSGVTVENSEAGVAVWNAEANLDGCTITDMDYGISIGWPWVGLYPSSVSIQGSTISNNDLVGVYVCDNSTLEAHFNNIVGNGYGLWNDLSETVDATYNWWGDASGPYHPIANPGGEGNPVSWDVTFESWLGDEAVTETVTNDTVDARDEADTRVVVTGTAMVIVARYPDNPGGDAPTGFSSVDKYIDVYVPDTTEVTELEIRLYYTDAELDAADVDEESLRLFWWNDTAWVQCSDSGVNTASTNGYSGYMWAKIRNNTTPSLDDLQGDEFGGYGHPSETPGGGCFIATAAYGTDTAKELDILREYRDEVLLPTNLGARLVSLYYKTSPPLANFISQHEVLRTAVRVGFVDPIVAILNWSHDLWST